MIERDQSAASRFSLSLEDWRTLQAAIDRIVPSDNDPGAEQTGVADFITGFLAGPDRVHARADGRGFIPLTGVALEAWKQRIDGVRTAYRTGLRRLRELARQTLESEFAELDAVSRDQVLRLLESEEGGTHAGKPPANQPVDTDARFRSWPCWSPMSARVTTEIPPVVEIATAPAGARSASTALARWQTSPKGGTRPRHISPSR